MQPRGALCAPAGNRAPNFLRARVSIASARRLHVLLHSPLRRGTKSPQSQKPTDILQAAQTGTDLRFSRLVFWQNTPGCPRPFFTNKTPGKLRKRTTGLSSHASYRSPGHGPFWVFTQNYSGPSDNQRNNAQSRRCFTVMRRRIRATKFGIAASSCTSTAVCESKEYGKV